MLQQILEQNKDNIIAEWVEQIINTYQPEMVGFLHKEKNQFANPVRNTLLTSTEKIYNALLNNINFDTNYPGLEEIIKLRTVQDFSPSQALSFLFILKDIIRNELQNTDQSNQSIKELNEFEGKMDKLTALAFDIYMNSRNKIYEIRLKEMRSQSQRAFQILGQ